MKIASVEATALMVPLEKPIAPSSSLAHADVVASVYFREYRVRLAAGEGEFTRFNFAPFLKRDALDIVQPNACRVGGITEARKIAQMASAFRVGYAPRHRAARRSRLPVPFGPGLKPVTI